MWWRGRNVVDDSLVVTAGVDDEPLSGSGEVQVLGVVRQVISTFKQGLAVIKFLNVSVMTL